MNTRTETTEDRSGIEEEIFRFLIEDRRVTENVLLDCITAGGTRFKADDIFNAMTRAVLTLRAMIDLDRLTPMPEPETLALLAKITKPRIANAATARRRKRR